MKLLARLGSATKQSTYREQSIAVLACLTAILLTAWFTRALNHAEGPILMASLGASAVILFAIPGSPLAQPWPFFAGQLVSALVGACAAYYVPDQAWAAGLAVGGAVLAMMTLRCLHPPGAASALAPVIGRLSGQQSDFDFILNPLGINVVLMLILAVLINRLVLRRDYPTRSVPSAPASDQALNRGNLLGIDQADIDQVTSSFSQFLDIGADELHQIVTRLQLVNFQKNYGAMTCGDIMQKNIVTLEYATEVETGWALMHKQHLKVMPVLDRTQRLIGIVTRYDFLKNLKLTNYESFQEKWLRFIKRTPDISTDKPEAIGHIMTRRVSTLSADAPVAELIPLMVNEGHHHVPIVDQQGHFLGMVFESQLIAALFNQQAMSMLAVTADDSLVR